jgi:arylsulfatase A-like enzyme
VVPGEYLTDRLTEATVRYLREGGPDAVPFFICLSHYAVHTPLQAKAANTTHFATKIETLGYAVGQTEVTADGRHLVEQSNATYAAMIKSVDESLGRIVDALQQLGLYEDTIIVLTSDHGGLSNCGPDRNRELATTNAPLRAGKGHLYEGGLRVPLLVRWPGVTHAGDQIGQPVVGLDIYPSILQMAGLPLRPQDHQDGVSFAPLLQGESPTTDRAFYWYSDRGRRDSTGDRNAAVVRQGDYKLVEFFTEKRVELYNLRDDVGETRNLIDAEPAVGGRLLADLAQWKRTMKVKDRKQERSRAGENYPY